MATATLEQPLAKTELQPIRHLVRGVWIEALRRNELWVVAILLGIYVMGALVLRIVGIGSEHSARFIRGLGFDLGGLLAALLVIMTAARQLPTEIELRTIYPVLAKPVSREALLWGKALPTWLLGVAAIVIFSVATVTLTPTQPQQLLVVLLAAILLKAVALAMLTAMAIWLSLWLPSAVAMLVAGALAFGGHFAANMMVQMCGEGRWGNLLAGLWPDFSLLDQFSRYVDGGSLMPMPALVGLIVYGALWTLIFGAAAAARFRRMPV